MIKRTIEISEQPAHLAVKLDQLLIQPFDEPVSSHASVPCEDIGVLILDQARCTISQTALARLAHHGASVIVTGRNHLPSGVLVPIADHSEVRWRVDDQIAALQRRPLCKRLWQQIVRAKINAQANNLEDNTPQQGRLRAMVGEVRSGDPTNVEAQAARLYWSNWAPPLDDGERFRRRTDGDDPLNVMLNYGYAIMRAALARAIVAAGLLPMLGIHHSSRANNFALADDLIEPLRPIVDRRCRRLYVAGCRSLERTAKTGLLELLTLRMQVSNDTGPLTVQLQRMVSSLVQCFKGEAQELAIPLLDCSENS